MDKKQQLRLIIAITSISSAIPCILVAVFGEPIPPGYRAVFLIVGVALCILSICEFTILARTRISKNITSCIAGLRIARESQIEENNKRFTEELKQDKSEINIFTSDRISVKVFGKTKSLKLFIQRSKNEIYEPSIYDYDNLDDNIPYKVSKVLLNERELDALKWLVKTLPHNADKVKTDLLEYVNLCYDGWDDDWEEAHSFEILPYEIDIKTVCLDFSQNDEVIALCGECNCDEEHGVAIAFRNRKFAGVSIKAEFAEIDYYDDNGQLKEKYKELFGK